MFLSTNQDHIAFDMTLLRDIDLVNGFSLWRK